LSYRQLSCLLGTALMDVSLSLSSVGNESQVTMATIDLIANVHEAILADEIRDDTFMTG
jgi:hypothetical protein